MPTNEWEEEFNRRVEFALASFHSNFGMIGGMSILN